MKERVCEISPQGSLVHIGTFHSSCARWLREFAPELGFTSDFTIYDEKRFSISNKKKCYKSLI